MITSHENFPKEGILFRDINPVFRDKDAIKLISKSFLTKDDAENIRMMAGIESRGFIVATALALNHSKGVIMIRKAGKLPGKVIRESYEIEYGQAVMEIQEDAIKKNEKIFILDDLIATGGTAIAAAGLIEKLGGIVSGFGFIIELSHLKGADKLRNMGYHVKSLVKYND